MAKFVLKINNRHKLKTQVNNLHSFKANVNNIKNFSIIAYGATICKSIEGNVKYISKVQIDKLNTLVRALGSPNSYSSITTLTAYVVMALLLDVIKYVSRTTASMFALLRVRFRALVYSSKTALQEEFIMRGRLDEERYKSNSLIDEEGRKLHFLSRMTSSTTYRLSSSLIAIVHMKAFMTWNYISRSNILVKAFLRSFLEDNIYGLAISIQEKISAKIEGELPYTSESQAIEKLTQRANLDSNIYKLSSNVVLEKILTKCRSVLTFRSVTTLEMMSTLRAYVSNTFKSATSIDTILGVKDSSQTGYRYTISGIEKFSAKAYSSVKYAMSSTVSSVPKLLSKLGIINSSSSSTSIIDETIRQYYTVRLNTYTNRKLSEVPQDLFSFCYVKDKNWMFVSKLYKSWADLKGRVASWSGLKE